MCIIQRTVNNLKSIDVEIIYCLLKNYSTQNE